MPIRKYYSIKVSRVQHVFTIHSSKMEGLATKLLHCKKAIFVTPCAFFFIGFSFYYQNGHLHRVMFVLSYLIHGDTYALSVKKLDHCQDMIGF